MPFSMELDITSTDELERVFSQLKLTGWKPVVLTL